MPANTINSNQLSAVSGGDYTVTDPDGNQVDGSQMGSFGLAGVTVDRDGGNVVLQTERGYSLTIPITSLDTGSDLESLQEERLEILASIAAKLGSFLAKTEGSDTSGLDDFVSLIKDEGVTQAQIDAAGVQQMSLQDLRAWIVALMAELRTSAGEASTEARFESFKAKRKSIDKELKASLEKFVHDMGAYSTQAFFSLASAGVGLKAGGQNSEKYTAGSRALSGIGGSLQGIVSGVGQMEYAEGMHKSKKDDLESQMRQAYSQGESDFEKNMSQSVMNLIEPLSNSIRQRRESIRGILNKV